MKYLICLITVENKVIQKFSGDDTKQEYKNNFKHQVVSWPAMLILISTRSKDMAIALLY